MPSEDDPFDLHSELLPVSCIIVSVVTGGPLPSDHEYELNEVRFHWGRENQRGSEHTVNFKAFPMEVNVSANSVHLLVCLFNGSPDKKKKHLNIRYKRIKCCWIRRKPFFSYNPNSTTCFMK